MDLVVIDWETFYSADYSLTKLTTEEYVRSPQFETIGVGIAVGDAPAVWYPKPEVEEALAQIDWSQSMVLAQNTLFDAAIAKWRYGINPKAWADTLGMSRALYPHAKRHSLDAQAQREGIGVKGDEVMRAIGKRYRDFTPQELAAYGRYCCNDVELTRKLFHIYMGKGVGGRFPVQELRLIDLTIRMFVDAVLELDKGALEEHLSDVKDTKARLLDTLRDRMLESGNPEFTSVVFGEGTEGLKAILMSNPKFAAALESFGVVPPLKVSPATGRTTYAFAKTDQGMLDLREHEDPRVQALVEARLGNKTTLEETRTERFIGMADRGAFPVPLRYYGAHSSRWSGIESVNLQNLPSRGPYAGRIKKAIKAPPGHVVIDCDSSQIEARTLAWLAGQEDLVQAFADKQDVYKLMASRIYGKPVDEIDKTERQIGKVVILGSGYGIGHHKLRGFLKLQAGVDLTETESKRIVDTYRHTYNRIPEFWARAQTALSNMILGREYTIDMQGLNRVELVHEADPLTEEPAVWGITLPSGTWIQYPRLAATRNAEQRLQFAYESKGVMTNVYGGLVVENVCQAVARCVIAEQALKVAKRYPVVLLVHDAVACVAPIEEKDEAQKYVEECMSWRPKWAQGLPLACESGMGLTYGDC